MSEKRKGPGRPKGSPNQKPAGRKETPYLDADCVAILDAWKAQNPGQPIGKLLCAALTEYNAKHGIVPPSSDTP